MYKIYFLFYQFFLVSNQEIQKQATFNNLFTCLSQLYELRIAREFYERLARIA
jgi:hypothetical protein